MHARQRTTMYLGWFLLALMHFWPYLRQRNPSSMGSSWASIRTLTLGARIFIESERCRFLHYKKYII